MKVSHISHSTCGNMVLSQRGLDKTCKIFLKITSWQQSGRYFYVCGYFQEGG